MTASQPVIALLDACILYSAPVRDLLLHLADQGVYAPKWSAAIQQEWTRNLLVNRPDLSLQALERAVEAMNNAFPDANVDGYELLIDSLTLPDKDDRHVLAAASQSQSTVIVTANLKDFPAQELERFGIVAQHPDLFICELCVQFPNDGLRAFRNQVSMLRNPPKTAAQVLATLNKAGLPKSAELLARLGSL